MRYVQVLRSNDKEAATIKVTIPVPKCGLCAKTLYADEDLYLLKCGCFHHMYCLLDGLGDFDACPSCKNPVEYQDIAYLTTKLMEHIEKELEESNKQLDELLH